MSSGCFLALWSPLTASFYQVRWFVQSLGHHKVNQSFSNGTFKTRLILVLSLPYGGHTNLSAPLKALGRLTQKLYSRHKCPLLKTHTQSHVHLCLQSQYTFLPSGIQTLDNGTVFPILFLMVTILELIYVLVTLISTEEKNINFHPFFPLITSASYWIARGLWSKSI